MLIKKILRIVFPIALVIALVCSRTGWRVTSANFSAFSSEDKETSQYLRTHVFRLSHEIGWRGIDQFENLENAAQYITGYFQQLGYQVEWQRLAVSGKTVKNIIAQKKGAKSPEKVITIGAHYDSYFSPGADSNASGVASLLELARILADEQTNATIHFVAFVNAAPPHFGTEDMGSARYLKGLKQMGLKISAAVILDSMGFYTNDKNSQRYFPIFGFFLPNRGNFVGVIGNLRSLNLVRVADSIMKKNLSLSVQSIVGFDFINSDHWVFWKENCEAVLITDTGPYRNPFSGHTADTYQTLNYVSMAQVVRGLAGVIRTLAY